MVEDWVVFIIAVWMYLAGLIQALIMVHISRGRK